MAATSVALLVLLPVELLSWVLVSDPTEHTTQWVADRWANSAWRAVDWVFLVVATVHGGVGLLLWLSRDGLRGWRQVAVGFVLAASAALLVLGSYTLFTFEIS
jgi:succinate dehydrogenase hydrophobic anchor subunit